MNVRVRIPGGERYSNRVLLGPRALVAVMLLQPHGVSIPQWDYMSIYGDSYLINRDGVPYILNMTRGDTNTWVPVDSSIVRSFRELIFDTGEASGISGFNLYLLLHVERLV